jgi:hypothetical protein
MYDNNPDFSQYLFEENLSVGGVGNSSFQLISGQVNFLY